MEMENGGPDDRLKVLFICTHNSCRSQMAEGLVNGLMGDRYRAYSAGTEATTVQPIAIVVLAEIGIDISHHESKPVSHFQGERFDLVVTVCDSARDTCPFIPGASRYLHRTFEDPSHLSGSEQEILDAYRRTRDAIRIWLEGDLAGML